MSLSRESRSGKYAFAEVIAEDPRPDPPFPFTFIPPEHDQSRSLPDANRFARSHRVISLHPRARPAFDK